mgnify:CR=1 FL=1
MSQYKSPRRLVLPAIALAACAFGACSGDRQLRSVRGNLSPNLSTLHQRPVDVGNMVALTNDTNGRMVWADYFRAAHLDRPSRLTPEPMPH